MFYIIEKLGKAFKHIICYPHQYKNEGVNIYLKEKATMKINGIVYKILVECSKPHDTFILLLYNKKEKYLLVNSKTLSREPHKFKILWKEHFDNINIATYYFLFSSGIVFYLQMFDD